MLARVCLALLRGVSLCYTMMYLWIKSVHKWDLVLICLRRSPYCIQEHRHVTLAIGMLNKILPLAY